MGSTINKAEYITITLHSRLAKIDAVGEQWLCISHTHTHVNMHTCTHTHTLFWWFSGTTVTDDFVSSTLTAGLCRLQKSPF